ncbi:hypothetical protein H6P81_000761 [Aristolochia fimbriata]|uniref:Aminotransferase-like plant mobile domain-containing protein n=1 Tax=Aristolochia fimbriata TaxID=158543 RepID=A0AAV7F5K6_ARIFI|nr:hypothetical protein H6P81_000761 [Aristolochia fimbriata]
MAGRMATIICRHGGSIMMHGSNPDYEGGVEEVICISKSSTYNDLLRKMHEVTGWDKSSYRILIKCKFPTSGGNYTSIEVKDDNTTRAMFGLFPHAYSVELYLEKENNLQPTDQVRDVPSFQGNSHCHLPSQQPLSDPRPQLHLLPQRPFPGPIEPTVLYEQNTHRSSAILRGENPGCLDCSEHFTSLHMWPVDDRIMPYIVRAGFAHFVKLRWFRLDRALITALIERWRRETQTFHLPFGEMTITLQDVAVLLGLRVDGDAVSGTTLIDDWPALAHRLLGQLPPPNVIRGGRIALTWLYQKFHKTPAKASEEVAQQYARAYLLHLLGATVLADGTGSHVHLMYLLLFEDFDTAGNYAWGSATLAFLYRELSKGCQAGAGGVSGCLSLLQLWAWEHLDIGRPHLLEDRIEIDGPLGTRWNGKKKKGGNSHGALRLYRAELEYLKPYQINWQPYSDEIFRKLPALCTTGSTVWRSRTPIICFEIVEMHVPDRVLLQFGLEQHTPPQDVDVIERISRKGRPQVDWRRYHESFVQRWDRRVQTVVDGKPAMTERLPSSTYMQWYLKITNRLNFPSSYSHEILHQPKGASEAALVGAIRHVIDHLGGAIAAGTFSGNDMSLSSYVCSYLSAVLQSLPTLEGEATSADKTSQSQPSPTRAQGPAENPTQTTELAAEGGALPRGQVKRKRRVVGTEDPSLNPILQGNAAAPSGPPASSSAALPSVAAPDPSGSAEESIALPATSARLEASATVAIATSPFSTPELVKPTAPVMNTITASVDPSTSTSSTSVAVSSPMDMSTGAFSLAPTSSSPSDLPVSKLSKDTEASNKVEGPDGRIRRRGRPPTRSREHNKPPKK